MYTPYPYKSFIPKENVKVLAPPIAAFSRFKVEELQPIIGRIIIKELSKAEHLDKKIEKEE